MSLLNRRPRPVPPEAPLSFFIQKQHRASDGADCAPDSADCFSTLPCLVVFIWPLYFRDLPSLFWPRRNLLFYFWLHSFRVSAAAKKRMWGGRGEDVVLGFRRAARKCLRGAVGFPTPRRRARPQGASAAAEDGVQLGRPNEAPMHTFLPEKTCRTWSEVTYFSYGVAESLNVS